MKEWSDYKKACSKTGGGEAPDEPAPLSHWDKVMLHLYGDTPSYCGLSDIMDESGVIIDHSTHIVKAPTAALSQKTTQAITKFSHVLVQGTINL